jgi:hypothetical protein
MSDMMKKLMMPMDARSSRGVFSRGKPVYKGGTNSPKSRNRVRGIMIPEDKEQAAAMKRTKLVPPKPKRVSPLQMAAKRRLAAKTIKPSGRLKRP